MRGTVSFTAGMRRNRCQGKASEPCVMRPVRMKGVMSAVARSRRVVDTTVLRSAVRSYRNISTGILGRVFSTEITKVMSRRDRSGSGA